MSVKENVVVLIHQGFCVQAIVFIHDFEAHKHLDLQTCAVTVNLARHYVEALTV